MSMRRNSITVNESGNIIMPENVSNIWMSEPELVACGRFGLLGLELNVEHVDRVALLQRRHLLVALETVRVRLAETGGHEHIARSHERLAVHVKLELGVLSLEIPQGLHCKNESFHNRLRYLLGYLLHCSVNLHCFFYKI